MERLSKEAERRLLTAVEETANLVNAGHSPNDAIVKVASQLQIPPGHINLVVTAYNNGRTAKQRQVGSDPLEKSAEFELADAGQILELLYPTAVKSAAEVQRATTVAAIYMRPPPSMLTRGGMTKAANAKTVNWSMGEPVAALPHDPANAPNEFVRTRELQRGVDEARRLATQAFDKVAAAADSLRDYFRTPGHAAFSTFRDVVTGCYGSQGDHAVAALVSLYPDLEKRAAAGATSLATDSHPCRLIGEMIAEAARYAGCREYHIKLASEAAEEGNRVFRPFVPAGPSPSVLAAPSLEKTAGQAAGFLAGMGIPAAKDMIGNVVSTLVPPPEKLVQRDLAKLTDPEHESELRAIRAHATVNDLVTNDPVISSYDPQEAIQAFNDVTQLAPRATDQRLLLQALMQKRLTQESLDPFELVQLCEMETKLRSRDEGINPPGKENAFNQPISVLS